jgi:hypothetical protein
MRAHRLEKTTPTPWRVPITVEEIPETGQRFDLAADEEARTAIARMAGLRDLPCLHADFEVTRQGGGIRVSGRVSATVGQNCVVTLEPLVSEVDEDVDLLFLPPSAAAEKAGDGETGGQPAEAKWDDPEPLIGGVVDLGALATEFLILGIDPYPRKPDAVFEPPRDLRPDSGPFAALAGWTKGRNDG